MGASTDKEFLSTMGVSTQFKSDWEDNVIKNEPMFFNCDFSFAYTNGGPITRAFLDALPVKSPVDGLNYTENIVFDSRVHMLMPGWYPAIPGWHHDDVSRPPIPVGKHFITAGQPDYDSPRYKSKHIMALVNAGISPTKFALGRCTMPAIPEGELIYRRWHIEIEELVKNKKLMTMDAPNCRLINFDWQTFHTGTKAVKNGWRWFGRVSINTDRVKTITNEIRRNAQVYLEFPMEGW